MGQVHCGAKMPRRQFTIVIDGSWDPIVTQLVVVASNFLVHIKTINPASLRDVVFIDLEAIWNDALDVIGIPVGSNEDSTKHHDPHHKQSGELIGVSIMSHFDVHFQDLFRIF